MVGSGIPEDRAKLYEEDVRRGGTGMGVNLRDAPGPYTLLVAEVKQVAEGAVEHAAKGETLGGGESDNYYAVSRNVVIRLQSFH